MERDRPRRKPIKVDQLDTAEVKELKAKYEYLMGGDGWTRFDVEMSILRDKDHSGDYRGAISQWDAREKLKNDKLTITTWEEANLVSSQCTDGFHRLVIDVDHPCEIAPTEFGFSMLAIHLPEHKDEDGWGFFHPEYNDVVKLDGTAIAIPSSQKGHFHVYSDHPYTWGEYFWLLKKLNKHQVIDARYTRYSIERGFTAVRKPWVRKLGR